MGLIPKTGRRSPKVVFLHAAIVGLLALGAVGMVFPFLLMLSGATRTAVDQHAFRVVPAFATDDTALFQKHIEALHNESPASLRAAWRVDALDFASLEPGPAPDASRVRAWLEHLDRHHAAPLTGYSAAPFSRSRPLNVRRFIHHLKATRSRDVHRVNESFDTDFPNWNAFSVHPPDLRARLGMVPDTAFWQAWDDFTRNHAAPWTLTAVDLTGFFHERVWIPLHGRGEALPPLTETLPESEALADAWELFTREIVHPGFVRLDPAATNLWHDFLRARHAELTTLATLTGVEAERWEDVPLPTAWREAGGLQTDWDAFLQGWRDPTGHTHRVPADALSLSSPCLAWQAERGEAPPIREANQWVFEQHRREIRRAFLTQHFATVWEILIVDGRGVGNTIFYCAMAVLLALIVNPLAAYALSRFRPPNAYALLVFLLLTMAFPPMVTQIPVFLMLRDFGLLNTFWALLLPGMAHGYSIFLLKGFFDSLPRDLYESASLDGAGEFRMFWMITFSLSKPILAVIALSAFVNAYTNFMFALLICQDERMWTLMVWIFQLQQNHGPGVMNAAFVLAALPTLLVFLLAQNMIMRGIVVPVEK